MNKFSINDGLTIISVVNTFGEALRYRCLVEGTALLIPEFKLLSNKDNQCSLIKKHIFNKVLFDQEYTIPNYKKPKLRIFAGHQMYCVQWKLEFDMMAFLLPELQLTLVNYNLNQVDWYAEKLTEVQPPFELNDLALALNAAMKKK